MTDQPLFDFERLGAFSQCLAVAFFAEFPHLRQFATMISSSEPNGLSLNVIVPSPSGDKDRFIQVWVDEVVTPSVGFGPNHTHGTCDDAGIAEVIDLCHAVFTDKLLIIEDVGGKYDGHSSWVDLRDPDGLLDEITSPYSPGTAKLKSWSGVGDRQVGLMDV